MFVAWVHQSSKERRWYPLSNAKQVRVFCEIVFKSVAIIADGLKATTFAADIDFVKRCYSFKVYILSLIFTW